MTEQKRPVVRLAMDNPQTLADLRLLTNLARQVGMPADSSVFLDSVGRDSVSVASYASRLLVPELDDTEYEDQADDTEETGTP